MIGVQVFGKGKIYKPTWTQNHPWAFGPRMVLRPALEKTQILIAHQKEGIDRTKKVPLAAKKSSARD